MAHRALALPLGLALALLAAACSGDDAGDDAGETTTTDGGASETAASTSAASTSTTGVASESDGSSSSSSSSSSTGDDPTGGVDPGGGYLNPYCSMSPPDGAALAPPLPTYSGTCPIIETGYDPEWSEAGNVIQSSGAARRFAVIVPDDLAEDEVLPVIFMWHWLGGSAKSFWERSAVQDAANVQRFIAVIPEAKGDSLFKWPFTVLDTDARMEEEFAFFDDMLACVAEQFNVEPNCVSSTGVSAGALFTGQLAGGRGDRLAAIMPLSGGVGGTVKPWKSAAHKMPALVLWGGPGDFCVAVDFNAASKELEAGLMKDGHFVAECIHNCGHSTPPFEVPDDYTTFAPLWMFALDHPYWLADGESPYQGELPAGYPEWCAIGVGAATQRVGECSGSEC